MIFEELGEYKKDLKKLLKKYHSLNDDIKTVKKVLKVFPNERPPFSYQIEGLRIKTCVIKVKKIACKVLKGKGVRSGMRLIYTYFEDKKRIIFIELYYKGNKENEDRDRIVKYFK